MRGPFNDMRSVMIHLRAAMFALRAGVIHLRAARRWINAARSWLIAPRSLLNRDRRSINAARSGMRAAFIHRRGHKGVTPLYDRILLAQSRERVAATLARGHGASDVVVCGVEVARVAQILVARD